MIPTIDWREIFMCAGSFIVTLCLFYFPARYMIDYGFKQNLITGLVVLFVCCTTLIILTFELEEDKKNGTDDFSLILNSGAAFTMLAVNICSAVSYILFKTGLANYGKISTLGYGKLIDFYLWNFIDVIPIIHTWQLLKIDTPLVIGNSWAGLPVLSFQLFVIYQVIKSFTSYKTRKKERDKRWAATLDSLKQESTK